MADRTTKVTLTAQVSNYISGMQKAAKATKDTGSEAAKLGQQKEALQGIGVALLGIGTVAAVGVGLAVKSFAEFDARMSQVKTLSHASADDMKALSEAALTLGQNIGFSANEVADAEIELVKAGVSLKDILGGGLKGALDLAAAGQIDVAQATEIASSAMVQFGLKGKDVTHISDLLAAGADKALGGVGDLGVALKYAGPVAASLGVSLEETVGTLAEFASNGILADQAGTSLRGVLSSLTSPSATAADVMKKYNIQLFDSQGKFIGLAGAAGQLQSKLGGLTEAERAYALGQIFGNQQVTAANILLKGGSAAVEKWTKAVNDQGFAAQQAAGKMDNLSGDVKKLGAAFQTDLIRSGGTLDGVLRGVVQTVTGLVKAFGDLPGPAQAVILIAGIVVAAVGLVGGAFLTAVPKIAGFKAAIDTVGWSMKGLSTAGGVVGIALTALVSAFAAFGSAQAQAQQKADAFKDSLDAQTGAITKNTRELAIKDLRDSGAIATANKLGLNLKLVTDAALGNADAISEVNDKYQEWLSSSKGSDADMTQNGILWQTLIGKIGGTSASLKDAKRDWENAQEALGEDDGSEKAKNGIGDIQAAAEQASGAVDAFQKQLEGLGQVNLDVSGATIKLQQAVADATKAVQDNGATLDLSTQKGRDNQRALDDIASSGLALVVAQSKANASTDQLTATMQSAHDQFINAAVAAGMSREAAEQLATQYGLVPKNVSTAFQTSGAQDAIAKAQEIQRNLDAITRLITIRVQTIQERGANPAPNNGPTARPGFADGGGIYGPGGPRDDRVPILASNGEHMFTAADVAAMGGQAEVYRFRAALHGRRFADGGAVNYVSAPAAPVYAGIGSTQVSLAGATLKASIGGRSFDMVIQEHIADYDAAFTRKAKRG